MGRVTNVEQRGFQDDAWLFVVDVDQGDRTSRQRVRMTDTNSVEWGCGDEGPSLDLIQRLVSEVIDHIDGGDPFYVREPTPEERLRIHGAGCQ